MAEVLKPRTVYRIRSRNLRLGVYDGQGGFIGIREKGGYRYLFREFDASVKDWGGGTVMYVSEAVAELPPGIELQEILGTMDSVTGRPVGFGGVRSEGGRGWFFLDTGEASTAIQP